MVLYGHALHHESFPPSLWQVVLKNCHNVGELREQVEGKITEFAGRGYRALGLAKADSESGGACWSLWATVQRSFRYAAMAAGMHAHLSSASRSPSRPVACNTGVCRPVQGVYSSFCATDPKDATWVFVCLLPLFDPPRHDTKETIERCHEKGIDVKMVTGDQLLIGKETSRQLGLGTDMYSTEALLEVCHDCCHRGSAAGTAPRMNTTWALCLLRVSGRDMTARCA